MPSGGTDKTGVSMNRDRTIETQAGQLHEHRPPLLAAHHFEVPVSFPLPFSAGYTIRFCNTPCAWIDALNPSRYSAEGRFFRTFRFGDATSRESGTNINSPARSSNLLVFMHSSFSR